MAEESSEPIAYSRLGPVGAPTPLVIAVPHAGRYYPEAMLLAARLPKSALETIEDRYADLLVTDAVRAGAVAIVARMARAFVDLNRDAREIDTAILAASPGPGRVIASPKVTGGLGVVPSRIAAGGAVWRRPLSAEVFADRIATAHVPYHAAIAAALTAAQARHGIAVLIDCHSMPPLDTTPPARIVIGDRHGKSAEARFMTAAMQAALRAGLPVARNRPYAGGHTLDRHGSPRAGRHALQIEIDRSLYLADDLRVPGPGLPHVQAAVAAILAALHNEARSVALAAE